eukprot:CAMPEP_0182514506 /NCGR_PEP_ID=MMETSP1321-20130603/35870_1 /TAXON_ID=91990 /ORGANISM="Bolidomonas sp., Strain RCC1657" /LENGTH=83 /DNA_ID=CAMNT_0024721711 /DNA_START=404 /DNA_END=655 /DNA_ORIENTATION=+
MLLSGVSAPDYVSPEGSSVPQVPRFSADQHNYCVLVSLSVPDKLCLASIPPPAAAAPVQNADDEDVAFLWLGQLLYHNVGAWV